MSTAEQAAKAEAFRALHRGPRLLLMANAWDAVSARIFEAEGFAAVATTSGGVSWAIGYPDGEAAPWDEVVEQTARIARAVAVPVTADIEAGFGATPEAVSRSIADIIRAGVVGVNLEDGLPGPTPMRTVDDAVARIRAAREAARAAGVPIVINARTDLYTRTSATRRAASTRRWREAGPISPPAPIASTRSRCAPPARSAGWCRR
jgi:2-methylisocitrate lyase-like PEP mutase family enzyme